MLKLIIYLIHIKKINQFGLKHLRSDLCDYADAYILVNGTVTVAGNQPRDRQNRPLILKNNAPFVSCRTRINNELIEDADDLDIVMPMYNLSEYRKNYRKTIGSLYNYYRDELNDDANHNNFANNNVVNSNSFQYKNKIIGNMLIQQLFLLLVVLELLILIMMQIILVKKI